MATLRALRHTQLSISLRPERPGSTLPGLFNKNMTTSTDISHLFSNTLDLSDWTFHRHKEDFSYDDISIPGLSQDVYRKESPAGTLSVGVFTYRGALAYIAWGFKDHKHCSYHAQIIGNSLRETIKGCPAVVPIRTVNEVVGFTLDGVRFTQEPSDAIAP